MPHTARRTPVFYLLFVALVEVVSFSFAFVPVLLEEDSDLVAFVFVLAGAALFVADLEGAEALAGVDSLDLLTVPLLLVAAGLVAALSEPEVLCLLVVEAFWTEEPLVPDLTEVGLSDLLMVPVLLIVLVSLFVLVRVFVRVVVVPVLRSPDDVETDFLPSLVVVLVLPDLASLFVRVLL